MKALVTQYRAAVAEAHAALRHYRNCLREHGPDPEAEAVKQSIVAAVLATFARLRAAGLSDALTAADRRWLAAAADQFGAMCEEVADLERARPGSPPQPGTGETP